MEKYIVFLRGINVSGQKLIKMVELRELLKINGFQNLKTYIQSGNLVFDYEGSKSEIESKIQKLIKESYGFEVPMIVLNKEEMENIFSQNPFNMSETDMKRFCVVFLKSKPDQNLVKEIEGISFDGEELSVIDDKIFLHCPNGFGRTKLNNNFFEKKLKTEATTRNWNTCLKVKELAS
jgi:uncharacterized protein (DUF1697 family)